MNTTFKFLTILIIIAGICIISCPNQEAHSEAVIKKVNHAINDELSDDEDSGLTIFASTLLSGISNVLIKNNLTVDNYFLFSVGKTTLKGESKVVSVGILNHVFTDIPEELKENLENL